MSGAAKPKSMRPQGAAAFRRIWLVTVTQELP
jgi:hypothetical protein